MINFRRRLFYSLETGEVLTYYMQTGSLKAGYSAEEEMRQLGLKNCGAITWEEPDPYIEASFLPFSSKGVPRQVVVTVNLLTKTPIFTYRPIPR